MQEEKKLLKFGQVYQIGDMFPGKTIRDFEGNRDGRLLAVGEVHVIIDGEPKVLTNVATEFTPLTENTAHGRINIEGHFEIKLNTGIDRINVVGQLRTDTDGYMLYGVTGNEIELIGYRLKGMLPVDPAEVLHNARTELRRYFTVDQTDEALLNHFDKQYGVFKPEVRSRIEELRKILRP